MAALLAGAGHWQAAALLYATNIAAVNLATVTVFLGRGITPHRWWEKSRARRSATVFMVFWIVALRHLQVRDCDRLLRGAPPRCS